MTDIQSNNDHAPTESNSQNQSVVDRLVFAALREQTRARRWRIGFVLFFFVYLTATTVRGQYLLRICVLSFRTHLERMEEGIEDIRAAARELTG